METVLDSDTFYSNRAKAKFHRRDDVAQGAYDSLSANERIKFGFGPVQVGKVDFGEWDEGDERKGTLRRLPLYLFKHDEHLSVDYPHGFPGNNERLECHCGRKHYLASSQYREVRMFWALLKFAIRVRTARMTA